MVKYVCWYFKHNKQVKAHLLYVDCTDKYIDDVANAVRHSLQRICNGNLPLTIYGQCNDSGGDGIGKKFFIVFETLGITAVSYLTTSCSFHNLQTSLYNGM